MSIVSRTLLLALVLGAGCVSPTIPIPPPEPQAMVFTDEGATAPDTWTFAYDPDTDTYADGIFYVFNRDLGAGVIHIAEPDGSLAPVQINGVEDDEIVVTVELEGQLGSTCVRLGAGRSDPSRRCN
jgi:hypothetical protein